MTLQELLSALDNLSPDELEKVRQHIEERDKPAERERDNPDLWIAKLDQAIAEFREGLSEEDLAEITTAMNSEYVNPKDLHLFDWLDDIPEDER